MEGLLSTGPTSSSLIGNTPEIEWTGFPSEILRLKTSLYHMSRHHNKVTGSVIVLDLTKVMILFQLQCYSVCITQMNGLKTQPWILGFLELGKYKLSNHNSTVEEERGVFVFVCFVI